MFVSETYEVQDCDWYDNASSDKSSNYTTKQLGNTLINNTIAYSNNEYLITCNVTGQGWSGRCPPVSLDTNENWMVRVKSKVSGEFCGLSLGDGINKHLTMIRYPNQRKWVVYGYINPNQQILEVTNFTNHTNTYYTMEVSLINGTLYYKIYDDNDTLLSERSMSLPSVYENTTVYPCVSQFPNTNSNNKITFKEFSVKKL